MTDDSTSLAAQIADSAGRLFSDRVDKAGRERAERGELDGALWRAVVDAGFDGALAAEASGGSAQGFAAVAPIFHGIGYHQVPLPLAETMVAALLLSAAGIDRPEGPLTLVEQGLDSDLSVLGSGGGMRISGWANRVPWARHATAAVVALDGGALALVALGGTPSVQVRPHANHAGLPADTLVFDNAGCLAVAARPPLALQRPVWTLGALARCLMMVGALEWTLEQSARYATERVQFGRPIGKNQALQQQLAVLAGDTMAARVAALVAAAGAPDSGRPGSETTAFDVAVAKVRCGEAATRAASIAHQVHGAIGFTHEHALHFATRRLWAWREEFGSDAWWAARLGRAAIAGGSTAFWPAITQRRFGDGVLA